MLPENTAKVLVRFAEGTGLFIFTPIFFVLFMIVLANAADCTKVSFFWGIAEFEKRPLKSDRQCAAGEQAEARPSD